MSTTHNHGHNILRLFDTLQNFLFTTCEKSVIITNEHGTYEFPHKLPKLGNLERSGQSQNFIEFCPCAQSSSQIKTFFDTGRKLLKNRN